MMMANPRMPVGLSAGGKALWKSVVEAHDLDGAQVVQLTEACRMKDRCDKLDLILRGDVSTWTEIVTDFEGTPIALQVAGALSKANETANSMKQLLAALRLPDEAGKRPQRRSARGAQAPSTPGGATSASGKVSSMDRARERAAKKAAAAGA